jgi:PhoH-like ATPase
MPKTFVLDTNVLLHSAQSMESLQDNDVVLPMAVIEELDKFKKFQDELGRNARQVIRRLDALREKGSLSKGVPLDSIGCLATGKLRITSAALLNNLSDTTPDKVFDSILDIDIPDNRIIRVAYVLNKQLPDVIFISKDINLRLKADALGIKVMDFEREKVDFETLFTGCKTVEADGEIINTLYQEKCIDNPDFDLYPNEFVIIQDNANPKHTAMARLHADGKLYPVSSKQQDHPIWNILPRNKEQTMALDLLMDPEVQVVTLVGQAGTGKTLLALAAALESTIKRNKYEKILVSRPIVPLGNDIGYLPGDKEQKLTHWMQPIFDNLDYLMQASDGDKRVSSKKTDDLINSHKIDLEALTYIRGRSIPKQFVIVDEAQNLTPHEVKTIISRAGEGTKMVLTGDPYQIDNPYLDASSNGLTYTVERLKSIGLQGHVTLEKSERSSLAAVAAEYL